MEDVLRDGESFVLFFPELEDVKIWVWQADGEGQPSGGVRVLDRANFGAGWNVLCGDDLCSGVFDPRGVVYAVLHGDEDCREGAEPCEGVSKWLDGSQGACACSRRWQYSVRLVRKGETANEVGEA